MAIAALLLPLACAVGTPRLSAPDAALRGREIEVSTEGTADGAQVRGRLRVAVPPGVLASLSGRPDLLVELFPDHVAGAGRWPMGPEERFFFAGRLFGRIFRDWGYLRRSVRPDQVEVHWRTDRGSSGHAAARRAGRWTEISFFGHFPRQVDLARFLPGLGAQLILQLTAFAVRARLEQLWREGRLSAEPPENVSIVAGAAPLVPWPAGHRPLSIPPTAPPPTSR